MLFVLLSDFVTATRVMKRLANLNEVLKYDVLPADGSTFYVK